MAGKTLLTNSIHMYPGISVRLKPDRAISALRVMTKSMAAAEAIYETQTNAPFSVLSVGSLDGTSATRIIEVPGLLSFLATGDFQGEVMGINDAREAEKALAAKVTAQYGPEVGALALDDTYTPVIPLTYWSFRLMMGLGFVSTFLSLMALWGTRKGRTPTGWFWKQAAIWNPLLPVFAISFGWIFTEVGRQPWIVYGLMTTATGVSPKVSAFEVLTSMVVYTRVCRPRGHRGQALPHLRQAWRRPLRRADRPGRGGRGRSAPVCLLRHAKDH